MPDPLPLSPRQVWALLALPSQASCSGDCGSRRERFGRWRRRALAIPDAPHSRRRAQLDRTQARPHRRRRPVLDPAAAARPEPAAAARRLRDHLGLPRLRQRAWSGRRARRTDANSIWRWSRRSIPGSPISDYYRYHPWHDDGGYLRALVEACREDCAALPSYGRVRSLGRSRSEPRAGSRAEPRPRLRAVATRRSQRVGGAGVRRRSSEVTWFELSGAASASLTMHAFLALAAEPACTEQRPAATPAPRTFPGCRRRPRCSTAMWTRLKTRSTAITATSPTTPARPSRRERVCELVRRSAHGGAPTAQRRIGTP